MSTTPINPRGIWHNTHPFECPGILRHIGVRVSDPFMHHGMTPPLQCVEVEYELPTMNTATYVDVAVPFEVWQARAKEFTKTIILNLDKQIADLTAHRDRLKQSLADPTLIHRGTPIPLQLSPSSLSFEI